MCSFHMYFLFMESLLTLSKKALKLLNKEHPDLLLLIVTYKFISNSYSGAIIEVISFLSTL